MLMKRKALCLHCQKRFFVMSGSCFCGALTGLQMERQDDGQAALNSKICIIEGEIKPYSCLVFDTSYTAGLPSRGLRSLARSEDCFPAQDQSVGLDALNFFACRVNTE